MLLSEVLSTAASGTSPAGTPSKAAVSSRDGDGLTTLIKTPTERSLVLRKERKREKKGTKGTFSPAVSIFRAVRRLMAQKRTLPTQHPPHARPSMQKGCTHTWALKAVLTALPFLHAGMWVTTAAVSWAKPFSKGRGTDPTRAAVQWRRGPVRVTARPSAWLITHERRPIALFTLDNLPVLPKGRRPQPIRAAGQDQGGGGEGGVVEQRQMCVTSFVNITSMDK